MEKQKEEVLKQENIIVQEKNVFVVKMKAIVLVVHLEQVK